MHILRNISNFSQKIAKEGFPTSSYLDLQKNIGRAALSGWNMENGKSDIPDITEMALNFIISGIF